MEKLKRHAPELIFAGFIAFSLVVGWFLPAFCAWTGTRQSRPSPLLWQIPLLCVVVAAAFCAALPRLPITSDSLTDRTIVQPLAPVRYSLRTLLLITTGVAITMAVLVYYPLVGGGFITAGMAIYFIRFWRKYPHHRLAASTLVACMFLPFAWLAGYKEVGQMLPDVLTMIGAFPTFFPTIWIGRLVGIRLIESPGLGFLLTALELAAGLWLIRLGPKRTIAYLLLVLLVAFTSSLFFYGAVRA